MSKINNQTAVSYATYRNFAIRYGIRITKSLNNERVHLSIKELSQKIKQYENTHNVKDSLY
jgi:hypothetical protein